MTYIIDITLLNSTFNSSLLLCWTIVTAIVYNHGEPQSTMVYYGNHGLQPWVTMVTNHGEPLSQTKVIWSNHG